MTGAERASERVRALAKKGTVGSAEAEALLSAIEAPPRAPRRALLLNPFERLAGYPALFASIALSVASVMLALSFGARFDGLLDLHKNAHVALRVALSDQVAAVVAPSLLYYGYARALARVRFVDFLGFVGLARLPLVLVAAPSLALITPLVAGQSPSAGFWLGTLLALGAVVVHVTWLFQGFRTASGLAGARLVGGFIGFTLVAEVVSKIIVAFAP